MDEMTRFSMEETTTNSANLVAHSSISSIQIEEDYTKEATDNDTVILFFDDIKKFANDFAQDFRKHPNHWYFISVAMAIVWAVYIILYNSRIQGRILTAVLRRFFKKGDINIGSFSISLLWGKFLFRDIIYVTEDFSFRVVDAIVQFHYWLPYLKRELSEDMSKCDERLWIELNGPELHVYNRSDVYSKLEEYFGLDPILVPRNSKSDSSGIESQTEKEANDTFSSDMNYTAWRDLIPVIKIDFNMARFVFGNRLVPSTLLLTMDKAGSVYSTKPAASSNDHFMHVVRSHAENFKVILAPSPKYTGTLDEPPRYMGEGFVVMSSSKIQFYYYSDEAGTVSAQQNNLLQNEDTSPPPVWGLDVKCEKGTNLSYGPWADRQREQLFKFFFPQDYQPMEIDKPQSPGKVRKVKQFDLKLTMLTEATIDILFSKEKETSAVHMTLQKGSYFEMTLPYVVKKNGYTIEIRGQMLYLDASTSLQYRSLLEAESLKYEIAIRYPRIWNQPQVWDMDFYGVKVSYHFLYAHKEFFHDLIEDWSFMGHPDILHFVPYTCHLKFGFKHFEIITLANEYNWVDCSSQHLANSHVAFCGENLQLMFNLPYVDFLPETVALKFSLLAKKVYLSLYLPPSNTTRNILSALDLSGKLNNSKSKKVFSKEKWRKFCKLSADWIDCWYVPEVELVIGYKYHPIPPLGPLPQANVSTPEKVELLLSPIRAPNKKKSPAMDHKKFTPEDFDALALSADTFTVDLRILHPSEIKLYGSILRQFIHLKENIFGEDQKFIDMSQASPYEAKEETTAVPDEGSSEEDKKEPEFDERKFRPFEVTVNIDIRNVKGHLMKDCSENEPACPTIELNRLVFEMKKQYRETLMQVLLSPVILRTVDQTGRNLHHSHLQEGFLLLSGFQMRGHAMFSDEGRKPWEETLEYGWLVELSVGSLSGKLSAPQMQHIITGLETFIFTALDSENCLRHPRPYHLCYHGDPQPDCPYTLPDHFCPTLDIIKYKMIRTSIDAVDFHLIESGSDLNLQVYPIRISTCNLHGQHTRSGITAHIQNIRLKNYMCGWVGSHGSHDSNGTGGKGEGVSLGGLSGVGCNTSGSGGTCNFAGPCGLYASDVWLEAASIVLGPLYIDAAVSSNILHHDMQLIQHKLLKLHDQKTKRLWFFWPKEVTSTSSEVFGKCGCVGGCAFFGSNRNGQRFFKPSRLDFTNGLNVAHFRINESGTSPGYGQSILHPGQFVFNTHSYSSLTFCLYEGSTTSDEAGHPLSSGYFKSSSPAAPYEVRDTQGSRSGSIHHSVDCMIETGGSYQRHAKHATLERQPSHDCDFPSSLRDASKARTKFATSGLCQRIIGESHSLGRPTKDPGGLSVPTGQTIMGPGSLSDLHLSADNVCASGHSCKKMPSSLSLQTELPLNNGRQTRFSISSRGEISNSSAPSRESPPDPYKSVHRTISVGSEALSEAFYSADEDQSTQMMCRRGASISPTSSQVSLPTVPEIGTENDLIKKTCTEQSPLSSPILQSKELTPQSVADGKYESPKRRSSSGSLSSRGSSTSSSSSNSTNTETCDYLNRSPGHSQTSLLHSSNSDISLDDVPIPEKIPRKRISRKYKDDYLSEVGSISSTSFISAVSSQNDGDSVDLHMQLNKPITESPLLMSSYINHMTQLRCNNWDSPMPTFEKGSSTSPPKHFVPTFTKMSEGFTDIRMIEGNKSCTFARSPPFGPHSNHTPSHPFAWDTPIFSWEEDADTTHDESDDVVGGVFDSNTTRTTVVMKLKKDVDVALSPIALESAQRYIESLTPVMEALHPLTIVNRAHFRSLNAVEGKNTLKKDRYMYWSRLQDSKKSGTPEQSAVVTHTYQESCFLQIQGQITVPRINVRVLQASIVEEKISFAALDNIRDLTCVSLFSLCLDGVHLQFYSGHQSKKSVQILMRNPKVPGKPKKVKSKTKQNIDLLNEPVYIETSERQQEENMISVSVNKLHVQMRRHRNESSLLKDASITAIPNHCSKVLFNFGRCAKEEDAKEEDAEPGSASATPSIHLEDERMGFIVFEAGLENVALKAVKRKGFGNCSEANSKANPPPQGTSATQGSDRRDSSNPLQNSSVGSGEAGQSKAFRTNSAPLSRNSKSASAADHHNTQSGGGTPSVPATAPPAVSTPFNLRRGTLDKGDSLAENGPSTSPSQVSNATGHSAGIPASASSTKNSIKDECQGQTNTKATKKDISSFFIELRMVWFNFAAPPHTPITRKIDYTRLDWNLLSTASPSINAWMNPGDRLTVAVIQFLHASERRRLGVMASMMAEALDIQTLHVHPTNKYSKLMPLSQTLKEDPSCQLCNVLRRYILVSPLPAIEANLTYDHMPKLATLRQAVVVLMRQWKNALYMPLLMEQTFKYRQAHSAYSYRSPPTAVGPTHSKAAEVHKILEEKTSLLQNGRESPLSNIEEDPEQKLDINNSEDRETDGVVSSDSSNLPPRHSLPSFPPRSSTASAIIPPRRPSQDSPGRFHFPKFGEMFEGTKNFFRGSNHQSQEHPPKKNQFQGPSNQDIAEAATANLKHQQAKSNRERKESESHYSSDGQSLIMENGRDEDDICGINLEPSRLPKEDFQRWMNSQQEHNTLASHSSRPTVTFNKGLDLPTLCEGIEAEDQESEFDPMASFKKHSTAVIQETHQAHFLEAHVIFEPLLSAVGVIAQQVTGGALEQLGANISVTGSVETLRVDIIESEVARMSHKKCKASHHHPGKFFLDIGSGVPAFLCEKVSFEMDCSKVPDESRGWGCLQPTLFVSRSALKQHTSTVVHFSLNVNYIAQQVNMPLLRLLHQISSMYQNARHTQKCLKEQRPSKTVNVEDPLPTHQHDKGSYSDVHEVDYKGAEYSLSLSEEQGTLSSLGGGGGGATAGATEGGLQAQRDSVVSSLSARPLSTSPPPPPNQRTSGARSGRPQTFAQRLRSSTKMGKGRYMNLVLEKEKAAASSPLLSLSASGSGLGGILCSDKSPLLGTTESLPTTPPAAPATPKCWRNIYYLVDLYATTPETKTVLQRGAVGEHPERYKTSLKYDLLKESKSEDVESGSQEAPPPVEETSILTEKPKDLSCSIERTPLVIFGLAKIQKTKLLATLSGLKLEAEMNAMHASITSREKVQGHSSFGSSSEMSLTGHIGNSMIVLLEGIAPNQQTVVRVTISKSQGLYSSLPRKPKDKNAALITISPVQIDIPQHPVILHDMMTRGTKQLSSTLQELRVTRPSRLSRGTTVDEPDTAPSPRPLESKTPEPVETTTGQDTLLHPLAIQFSILLQEMSIHAALLPSLQATYCMQQVSSLGITGSKAKFTIHLTSHHLAFSTKIQDLPVESSLPPSAQISLPQVHVEAEYLQDDSRNSEESSDGMVLCEGSYLSAIAEIGALEHSLTTDLLNHLVFVQKVFMKEVNEVVQKMAGSDKPVPLWGEDNSNIALIPQRLLFTIRIKLEAIIITATTPTQSAVRLETKLFELELSNRVQNVGQPSSSSTNNRSNAKIFGKAKVNISLSLGQLIRNELFEEIEPELQQLAYFFTVIGLRNAFHDELTSVGNESEVVLITLTRPRICVQPLAVDKAVLVWLNYKNAYEYWNEQRASLNKEVLTATQQVFEKVPQLSSLSSAAAATKSKLFLQLTVHDIGVCLPINPCRTISHQVDSTETKDALVVTLDSTRISACNSGSLVCKAHFNGFCMRFAPDFETHYDDWKPDYHESFIMNLCRVSEGTYDVCSRTIAQNPDKGENAKWLLNIHWQMEGVDLHLDVNIGKHLSSLARTLTMLTSAPDTYVPSTDFDSDEGDNVEHTPQDPTALPGFIFDPHMDARQREKLLEIALNEQAKTVSDLKSLGASASTIESEEKLQKMLEQILSNDFRNNMLKMIRRQSIKASSVKDRFGLGPKLQMRSKSVKFPSPTMEVKEPIARHASIASGSTDSNPVDELDGDVFVQTSEGSVVSGRTRTPTPSNASDTETETITITHASNDDIKKGTYSANEEAKMSSQSQYDFGMHSTSAIGQGPSLGPNYNPQDPSIDLELDVKVSINSGECILYNKDFTKEEEIKNKMKKDRSFSGGIFEAPGSPGSIRKKSDLRQVPSNKLKPSGQSTPSLASESTGFSIPGLDVKVHYESHNVYEETPASGSKPGDGLSSPCRSTPLFPHPLSHTHSSHSTPKFNNFVNKPRHASTSPSSPPTEFHSSHLPLYTPSGYASPTPKSRGYSPSLQGQPLSSSSMSCKHPPRSTPFNATQSSSASSWRPLGRKRASLFTWMTLQSIPEETMISPNILDFLEKVLQPIPISEMSKSDTDSALHIQPELIFPIEGDSSFSGQNSGGYASFPVDVIVYFHMQPSTIRFSCQPVSRIECLLKLPSLNVVFSSKRTEERDLFSQENGKFPSAMGGLSVTGVLEDFSLFVFHPYGGKHRGANSNAFIGLNESERKDSLSVMVGFVKFHISRSRKISFKSENLTKLTKSSGNSNTKAIIRFSTIVDIGEALFKYDMRRLTEILAFPRAWYRRTIVRRLFLGDMTSRVTAAEQEEPPFPHPPPPSHSQGTAESNSLSQRISKDQSSGSIDANDSPRWDCGAVPPSGSTPNVKAAPTFWKKDKLANDPDSLPLHHSSPKNTIGIGIKRKSDSWETLVQFAVNFTKLNVHMNMGNVMGNVVWTTKDFKANGRLSIGSTGHKNMYIGLGLGGSSLEAKGGIVGGTIELNDINVYSKIREDPGTEPDHVLGIKLFASQSRLDYMGTSVLMARVSSFSVTVKDEWKLKQCAKDDEDTTRRGATIFILGDIEWDQLQLLISKSTTSDLLKMYHKLEEFFSQQFRSSKRLFSSLQPGKSKSSSFKHKDRNKDPNRKISTGTNIGPDTRHHRHWQGVLSRVSGLRLTTLPLPLPVVGTVLGGSLELHGKTIFLACFHGINFRSKSWALFSLREPYINFTSDVQEIPKEGPSDIHIAQNLTFSLGIMEQTHAQHVSMAKVCRITRNMVFPPQFRTLQEWFFYAFCSSDMDDVDRFPSLDSNRTDSLNSTSSTDTKRSSPRLQEHNHSSETIFALPSMEINLNTKHLQTSLMQEFMDEKPKVECSFVTEFQDHIFVTVDAENFFFLHDLISSYIKDTKEKMGADVEHRDDRRSKSMKVNEATQILQQDWREFTCDTWHLEPTVRLLSWATRNLESYGVDYILNKLGFSHASTTIPKWLQRGCMDPLDKILSLLMHRMITTILEHDAANR